MKASLLNKLDNLSDRFEELTALLGDAEVIAKQTQFRAYSKEYAEIEPVIATFRELRKVQGDLEGAQALLKESDPDLREMAEEEVAQAKEALVILEDKLQRMLLPKDPNDGRNVYLEVRAGTGGDEAAIRRSAGLISMAACSSGSGSTATPAPTREPNMDIVIQWESEGEDVRQYQERLVELGYLESRNVTGKFNQPTVDATKAFQTMNDLKVDGAAGPESLKRIYSDDALNADGVRIGDMQGSTSVTMVADVLSAGMSGEQVRQVQSRLAALGYLSASFVSGVYDTQTEQAVRQFQ